MNFNQKAVEEISKENKPKIKYLIKTFIYITTSCKFICFLYLFLSIIFSILQPLSAYLWGYYLDSLDILDIHILIIILMTYFLINFLISLIHNYIYSYEDIQRLSVVQSNRLREKFSAKLYKKIHKLYPDYLEVSKINDLIDKAFESVSSEWSSLQRGVLIDGYAIIAKVVSIISISITLYIFNPYLCLIIILSPLPTLYTTYIGEKIIHKFSKDNNALLREANYYQNVLLSKSASEVKALNLFQFFYKKWEDKANLYYKKERKNQRKVFYLELINTLIICLITLSSNLYAIYLLTINQISIGVLGSVFALITTLIISTTTLFSSFGSFIGKKNEAATFYNFIDLSEQEEKENTFLEITKIQLVDICYKYPLTDKYVLKNINLTITKGEKIAFVGLNGAGKTTLTKIISGLLQPTSGQIYINDILMDNKMFKSNLMSNVFQYSAKFYSFRIDEVVGFGNISNEINQEAVDESLKFSLLDVSKNDMLGKEFGGIEVSGGQWAKIGIARCYYANKDFIILDEPTSSIDPISESILFNKYLELGKNKTLIIVTHRISLATKVDRILVFKDYQIVEDGNHHKLMEESSEYKLLYTTQSKWYNRT